MSPYGFDTAETSFKALDMLNAIIGIGEYLIFAAMIITGLIILGFAYRRWRNGETIGSVLFKRGDKNNRTFREGFTPTTADNKTETDILKAYAATASTDLRDMSAQARAEFDAIAASANAALKDSIPAALTKAQNLLSKTSISALTDPNIPSDKIPAMPHTDAALAAFATVRANVIVAISRIDHLASMLPSNDVQIAVAMLSAKVTQASDLDAWTAGYDGSSIDPTVVATAGYVRLCRRTVQQANDAGRIHVSSAMNYVIDAALMALI